MSQSLLFYQPVTNNLSNRCRSKKLGKALFSGRVATTKHNLSQKKYVGDLQNRRGGFMGFFGVIIRTREI